MTKTGKVHSTEGTDNKHANTQIIPHMMMKTGWGCAKHQVGEAALDAGVREGLCEIFELWPETYKDV